METSKKPRRVIPAFLLILVLLGVGLLAQSFMVSPPSGFTPPPSTSAISSSSSASQEKTVLESATASVWVRVYSSNGTLIGERQNLNDLILNEFNAYLLSLLGAGATGYGCSSLSTMTAQQYACLAVGSTATMCASYACGVILRVGTNGTAASRADYALNTAYGGYFVDNGVNPSATATASPSLCHIATTTEVYDINGSMTVAGGAATLKEVGAFLYGYNTVSGAGHTGNYAFMIFHDVFAGISIINGDVVDVSYQLNLANAGFTTSLCYLLAGELTGNIQAGGKTVSIYMTTTTGETGDINTQFLTWCATGGNAQLYTVSCANAFMAAYEGIGTGSSAFTPSTYKLTAQVLPFTYPAKRSYSSTLGTATMYWTSTFNIPTSNSIQEAGLFMYLTLNGVSNQFMLFATTFSAQTEVGGNPFPVSLWITD